MEMAHPESMTSLSDFMSVALAVRMFSLIPAHVDQAGERQLGLSCASHLVATVSSLALCFHLLRLGVDGV
eukprot:782391-Rhodomonas_salina.1